MISDKEARQRIVAARSLWDISQREMSVRGRDEFGLDVQELQRTERGGKNGLPVTKARRQVLAALLDVPEWWFTAPREAIRELLTQRRAEELIDRATTELREVRGLPPLPGELGRFQQEPQSDSEHPQQPPNQAEGDSR